MLPSLGMLPTTSGLPTMPTFLSTTPASGLDLLVAAATSSAANVSDTATAQVSLLPTEGPYNPAAALPPKIAKKILNLEFVEMAELQTDIWVEEPPAAKQNHPSRWAPAKPPVADIKLWLECYTRMAALLVTRFPEKGPELWAYQMMILGAAHNYEGGSWVAYDSQFWRDMLARKDLNWSTPNARLYNEAFTGRAKVIPCCLHCVSKYHTTAVCLHNPNPVYVGWFHTHTSPTQTLSSPQRPGTANAISRYGRPPRGMQKLQ